MEKQIVMTEEEYSEIERKLAQHKRLLEMNDRLFERHSNGKLWVEYNTIGDVSKINIDTDVVLELFKEIHPDIPVEEYCSVK